MTIAREAVRELDRRAVAEFGVPSIVLMENAGRGAAELLVKLGIGGRVDLCCGKGNNGGDGFVMARHLDLHRLPVRVLLLARAEELAGDAATNYNIIIRSQIEVVPLEAASRSALEAELEGADWVVDGLLGTGLSGAVRPPFDRAIEAINRRGVRVLAVDIPSGLDCDTGQPLGATVRALHTATFVAAKKGFAAPTAREWTGTVHVVDIGAPRLLVEKYQR